MVKKVKNISLALKFYAESVPNKTFIQTTKQKTYSYKKVNDAVNNVCFFLYNQGLRKGDIIPVIINNSVEYIIFYLASLRFGTIFNPYPFTLDSVDIKRYLKKIDYKIVFCQKRHYLELKKHIEKTYLINEKFIHELNNYDQEWDDIIPENKTPACLYYSSGTTGNPKHILFSHKNMIENISSIVKSFNFNSDDIHLIVLPLGHTASINYSFLPATFCGSKIIVSESFWKIRSQFWQLIKKEKVSYMQLVPSILLALLNTPYDKKDYAHIRSLRFIGCGSSMLPKQRQIAFFQKFGFKIANLYGLSETGPTHIDYPITNDWQPGSIGKPLDVNEVRFINQDGKQAAVGEIGEIIVKGENLFIDYYNNNDLYNSTIKNGFFHTGDIGYVDKNGLHYFVGRKKELIIKGGINISPDEIDEIIYKINEVSESLTSGIPDEYLGEKIVSYIVIKNNCELTEEDVIDHCKSFLSRDKIPDKIFFVDKIPEGHSGKFLRKELINISNA